MFAYEFCIFRMITTRTMKEWGLFAALIVTMHYAYYKIQHNPSLVQPDQRQELFYVRWLKQKIPSLRKYGVQEETKQPPE